MSWKNSNRLRGWTVLSAAAAGAALAWGALLPAWGRTPAWQERLGELERQGVNPGAMYYTDHPRLLERLRHRDRSQGEVGP